MKLNVLSVAYPLAPVGPDAVGGAEQVLAAIDHALVAAGHRSTVLACEGSRTAGELVCSGPLQDLLDDAAKQAAKRRHRERLAEVLRSGRFDIVHFPEWRGIGFCSVQAKKLGLALTNTVLCTGVHSPTVWHDLDNDRDPPSDIPAR